MNRATRDKFVSGTGAALTSGNAVWETPPAVYVQLAADFGPFDLDLTADAGRALSAAWFGPGSALATDALLAAWAHHGWTGYSNPPYGRFVPLLLRKATEEATRGFTTTLLLPLRVTRAFQAHVMVGASDLIFCDRRICFYENGLPRCDRAGRPQSALFDSIIVIIRAVRANDHRARTRPPQVSMWKVPPHVPSGYRQPAIHPTSPHLRGAWSHP